MSEPARPRRTQEERSAAMRQRLLEATIDCLVEYGYAGTTTARVADRAGVTRGAQVHHFLTKANMVTAAVRYLAVRRTEVAFQELDRLKASSDRIGDALDLLWEVHRGPVFSATVELWVAARTDPDLRSQVAEVEPVATSSLAEFGKALFGDVAAHHLSLHFMYTAMDTVRGILIGSFGLPDDDVELDARWQRAKGHLVTLAGATFRQIGAEAPSQSNI